MYKGKKPEDKYSTIELLEASVAVNRFNKGYEKDDVRNPEDHTVKKVRNRNLILALVRKVIRVTPSITQTVFSRYSFLI